jgi:branched-chain amino acid transport system ATP-binding protein
MISSLLEYKTNSWQAYFATRAFKEEQQTIIERSIEMLKFLELQDCSSMLASSLPHGYQRKLGLAIAMAASPKVLLIDEPTTGMNHEEAMGMVDDIKKINEKGITVILIEHNMKVLLNVATRVAVLSFGNKIADGDPYKVMNLPEVVEAYLGTETI